MSPTLHAICAIFAFFLAAWMLMIVRDPKRWRLWWLDIFGVIDMESTREQRRTQESHISLMAYTLFFLLLTTAGSCSFWTFDQIREIHRPKSTMERDFDYVGRYIAERNGR